MDIREFCRARIARGVYAALFIAPVLLTSHVAADLIIDDFSDIEEPNQWPVVLTAVGSTTISEVGLAGVIGSSRETTIFANSLAEPGLDDVTVTVAALLGKLDYASTVGAEGSLELFYDGAPGNGFSIDLSGESQFEIEFLLFDHSGAQDLPVTITLLDGQEDSISLTRSLTAPGMQTLVFELNDFTRGGGDGVDMTDIAGISVFFDGALATDFRVEEIRTRTVPTPGALVAIGIGVMTIRRRRRR